MKYNKKELQEALDESKNWTEVARRLKLSISGDRILAIKNKSEQWNVCFSNFNKNKKTEEDSRERFNRIKNPFIKNGTLRSGPLKKRMIEYGFEYKCKKCGLKDEWQGEKIVLQVDHINGTSNDNRVENLRFICPNCHSQTKNWGNKKPKNICEYCEKEILRSSKTCRKCAWKNRKPENLTPRKFDPSKEELIDVIKKFKGNIVKTGKHYDVSDNAIRKRCKKLNVDWKNL